MPAFLRHLRTPFSTPVLLFVAVTALLASLAAKAGMFGLPLGLVVLYAFAGYALALVESQSQGKPLPVLTIEMINPAHHPRPLGMLALLLMCAGVGLLADHVFGTTGAAVVVGLELLALPAMLALLCVDDSWFSAVSPVHIARLVAALGWRYAAFLAVTAAYLGLCAWLAQRVAPSLAGAASDFAVLSLATLLGGIVYDRREYTGIDAWIAPELDAAKERSAHERRREQAVHEMYGLMRANKPQAAWDVASAWLSAGGNSPGDVDWMRARIAGWDDRRIADRLTRELVARHLRFGDNDAAVQVVGEWLAGGGDYRPGSARELGRLIGLARMAGRDSLVDDLLGRCSADYACRLCLRPRDRWPARTTRTRAAAIGLTPHGSGGGARCCGIGRCSARSFAASRSTPRP
jgi:hypothetical protein